jgi:hypothetical protein
MEMPALFFVCDLNRVETSFPVAREFPAAQLGEPSFEFSDVGG